MSETLVERLRWVIGGARYAELENSEIAVRVLQAMREPTESMLGATGDIGVPDSYYIEIWQAMIDQAIKEGEQ